MSCQTIAVFHLFLFPLSFVATNQTNTTSSSNATSVSPTTCQTTSVFHLFLFSLSLVATNQTNTTSSSNATTVSPTVSTPSTSEYCSMIKRICHVKPHMCSTYSCSLSFSLEAANETEITSSPNATTVSPTTGKFCTALQS